MINLEKVKPGDVLTYRGNKCIVKKVTLARNEDLSEDVDGINLRFLDGSEASKWITVCKAGFKYLDYFTKNEKYLNTKVRFVGICPGTKFFTDGKVYDVVDGKITDETGHVVPSTDGKGFESMDELNEFFGVISGIGILVGMFGPVLRFEEVNE